MGKSQRKEKEKGVIKASVIEKVCNQFFLIFVFEKRTKSPWVTTLLLWKFSRTNPKCLGQTLNPSHKLFSVI